MWSYTPNFVLRFFPQGFIAFTIAVFCQNIWKELSEFINGFWQIGLFGEELKKAMNKKCQILIVSFTGVLVCILIAHACYLPFIGDEAQIFIPYKICDKFIKEYCVVAFPFWTIAAFSLFYGFIFFTYIPLFSLCHTIIQQQLMRAFLQTKFIQPVNSNEWIRNQTYQEEVHSNLKCFVIHHQRLQQ